MIAGNVRDRGTERGTLPVRVENERLSGMVKNLCGLSRVTVLGRETVRVIVAVEKGVFDGSESIGRPRSMVNAPESVISSVQGERANRSIWMVSESISHPIAPGFVFEGKDEFAHRLR